jgi:hypothetical protein
MLKAVISFALVLTAVAAVGCTSSVDPEDTEGAANANDESGGTGQTEEALGCSLMDRSCYHEYVGHYFTTQHKCNLLGTIETGGSYGFMCIPVQPSGHYYLWIWSPTCRRGKTWQQCRK